MKKIWMALIALTVLSAPATVLAQDTPKAKTDTKKETREIIIRQKGEKDKKIKVEVDGEKITVNGKPLTDFKDEDITVSKRTITVTGKNKGMRWNMAPDQSFNFDFSDDFGGGWESEHAAKEKAFLGVTTESHKDGVEITEVVKGSAAEKAGLKAGDIITKIDAEKISSPDNLADIIGFKKPEDEVKVFYKRGTAKETSAKAVLGKKKTTARVRTLTAPRGDVRVFTMPPDMEGLDNLERLELLGSANGGQMMFSGYGPMSGRKKIGLKLQDLEEGDGVKVIHVEDSSAAATAGIIQNDIITEIDGKKINNTDDAREQLMPAEGKKSYEIKALRNGSTQTFQVKIPRKLKTANF
ncbi:MAG TPA: PDZ domain-containing protein [Ferruginibacter sp.]|nr:PDZ domain-containing protein [Ferruginibacter sp.]HMP19729.1 PDZ domain-containing protein [Ferruginibacter sp.]